MKILRKSFQKLSKILNILYVISFFWFILILLKLNTQLRSDNFDVSKFETMELLIFLVINISFFIYYRNANNKNES